MDICLSKTESIQSISVKQEIVISSNVSIKTEPDDAAVFAESNCSDEYGQDRPGLVKDLFLKCETNSDLWDNTIRNYEYGIQETFEIEHVNIKTESTDTDGVDLNINSGINISTSGLFTKPVQRRQRLSCFATMCTSDSANSELDINSGKRISEKSHKCSYNGCNVSYGKLSLLKRHMIKHTGERPYQCDINGCNKFFQQPYHLKRHKSTIHSGADEFACDERNCEKVFNDSFSLKKHKTRVHLLHKCSQCLKVFKKKYQLRNHIFSHGSFSDEVKAGNGQDTSRELNKCSFEGCGASYRKLSYLTLHMRKHTGERPFVCDIEGCDKSYTQGYHLKRHKARAHEPTKEYICKEKDCGKILSDKYNLKKHIDRYHSFTGPYKCLHCMQGFYKKYVLRKHLAAHFEDSGPIKCNKCHSVFPTRTNYLKHMSQHKTYSCNCGEIFQRWHAFRRHKKRYCMDQKTAHICTVCNKSFTTGFNLKQHSIVHSEVKEVFRCHYLNCDRSYQYKKNLMFHINHFHEKTETRYECPLPTCTMTFKEKVVSKFQQYMKRHVENVHINPKEKKKERKPRKDKGIPKAYNQIVAMSGLNPAFKKLLENPKEDGSNIIPKERKPLDVTTSCDASESINTLLEEPEENVITIEKTAKDARLKAPSNVIIDMLEVCYSLENSPESSTDEVDTSKNTSKPGTSNSNHIEIGDIEEATNSDVLQAVPEEMEGDTIEMNGGLKVEFVVLSSEMNSENGRVESLKESTVNPGFTDTNDCFSETLSVKIDSDIDVIKVCNRTL